MKKIILLIAIILSIQLASALTIFSDNFESGTLTGWTLTSAAGANNWTNSLTNPFEGTRHAQSQPQSTSEPASVLEKAINTSNYQTINFSYYRKLIGIDSADEFQVEWFNGTGWTIVEQTGSAAANDASYILKSFILPLTANNNPNFKIKFECTAGAVSEFCRTDNVTIRGDNIPDTTSSSIFLLSPTNGTIITTNTTYFNARFTDNINVSNATLHMWNSTTLIGTNFTTLGNSSISTNISFALPRTDTYFWNYLAIDSSSNQAFNNTNFTLIFYFPDITPPSLTALTESPTDPAIYSANARYEFNVTVTDASTISSVILEFNNTNYTATNIVGNIYNVSIINLAASPTSYSYRWYANDSSGNSNATETGTYTINKALGTIALLLNDTTANITIIYPSRLNASATSSTGVSLLRNDIDVTSQNGLFQNLSAGLYNLTATAFENQNYTSSTITRFADLLKGVPNGSISISPTTIVTYPTATTTTATENNHGDTDVIYNLFRDAKSATNPETITLGVGTYNYTFNSTEGQNWSRGQYLATQILTVNHGTGDVRLFLNETRANITIEVGRTIFINASLFAGQFGYLNLTQNSLQLNFTDNKNITYNQTFSTLGDFNISVRYTGNTNYTADTEEWFVTVIDTTSPNITSLTEFPTDPTTYTSGQNYFFNATITDATDIQTVLIEFNRVNYTLTNSTGNVFNFTISNLAAGTYNYYWRVNDTKGNVNLSIQSYVVNNATGDITLLINGTGANQTAIFGTKTNASATTQFGTITLLLDGIDITSNNDLVRTHAAGNYNYTTRSTGDQNHSSTTITRFVHINRANAELNLTLNKTEGNITINPGTTILINGTLINGDATGSLELYRNGTLINIGTRELTNQTNFTIVGLHNITLFYRQSQNYTENTKIYFVNVIETPILLNITCEAGGPYQQTALVLVQGNVTDTKVGLNGQNVNITLSKSNNIVASKILLTTDDGGFKTTFSALSTGSYNLNSTISYQGRNATCEDNIELGFPASFVLNKLASVYNTTNASISYNITLILINIGNANATNVNITDTDSLDSPYNISTLKDNSNIKRSYLKNFSRNDTVSYYLLTSAIARGIDTYSNLSISANSTEVNITITPTAVGIQLVITKNILYTSETSLNISYNVTSILYNSGDQDLTSISYIDTDIKDTSHSINLTKGSSYILSNLKLINKAASNIQHEFALGTTTINSLSFYSNRPKISIPGYGGPADVIVRAPATVNPSASMSATIEIKNVNLDIGQDFPINYWITNEAETQNYSSGQKTVYLAANTSFNTTIILTTPSSTGTYKLRALASWAGGTATAFDSFEVRVITTEPESGTTKGEESAAMPLKNKTIEKKEKSQEEIQEKKSEAEIVCNSPYIRHGIECCLDQNNNSICDKDEKTEEIKEQQKTESLLTIITGFIIKNLTEMGKTNKLLIIGLIFIITITIAFIIRHRIRKKKRQIGRLRSIIGLKVYTSDGDEIGKLKDIIISNNKIESLKIKLSRKAMKKIKLNKKGVIINYKQIEAMKEIIIINKRIWEGIR